MAHCPQQQIDKAYELWRPGMEGHDDPTWAEDLDTRALKRGWKSGYTMGEDAGFDRGWHAAEWYFRPLWLKLWQTLRGVKYKEHRRYMA